MQRDPCEQRRQGSIGTRVADPGQNRHAEEGRRDVSLLIAHLNRGPGFAQNQRRHDQIEQAEPDLHHEVDEQRDAEEVHPAFDGERNLAAVEGLERDEVQQVDDHAPDAELEKQGAAEDMPERKSDQTGDAADEGTGERDEGFVTGVRRVTVEPHHRAERREDGQSDAHALHASRVEVPHLVDEDEHQNPDCHRQRIGHEEPERDRDSKRDKRRLTFVVHFWNLSRRALLFRLRAEWQSAPSCLFRASVRRR